VCAGNTERAANILQHATMMSYERTLGLKARPAHDNEVLSHDRFSFPINKAVNSFEILEIDCEKSHCSICLSSTEVLAALRDTHQAIIQIIHRIRHIHRPRNNNTRQKAQNVNLSSSQPTPCHLRPTSVITFSPSSPFRSLFQLISSTLPLYSSHPPPACSNCSPQPHPDSW
jgi:hypothetical protein